jgi:glycine/D-amino acid oxidase-like deaminating enzyme
VRFVVAGAGIVGAATALAGAVVLEIHRPAAMASGRTLAGVRRWARDPAELPSAREAVDRSTAIRGGLIDVAPDGPPTPDRAPRMEGPVVAAGFAGQGFAMAPAVGPALADRALGRRRPDLAAFRFGAASSPAAAELHG